MISQELDDPLRRGERFSLGVHRFLCGACRRFCAQLGEVEESWRSFVTEDADEGSEPMPAQARERIVANLREATQGGESAGDPR